MKKFFVGDKEDSLLNEMKADEKKVQKEGTENDERKPNSNQIRFFEKVGNFRDVGLNYNRDSGTQKFKEGVFFRSATLDFASEEDLKALSERLGLHSIIDLRSKNEVKAGNGLVNTFPNAVLNKGMAASAIESIISKQSNMATKRRKRRVRTKRGIKKLQEQVDKTKHQEQSTYYINFASNNYRKRFVWDNLSISGKYQVVKLMATNNKPDAIKFVGEKVINPQGLEGLYRGFIDHCGREIVAAMRIMASPDSWPLLIHCTQGKDRTGIVCAMTMALCGASEEMIMKDYSRSEEGLSEIKEDMIKEMAMDGLNPEFTDAPLDVMKKTFDYVRETYGGVENYLFENGMEEKHKLGVLCHCLVDMGEELEAKMNAMCIELSDEYLTDSSDVSGSSSEEEGENKESRRERRERRRDRE